MSSTEEKPAPIIFGDKSLSDVTLVVDNQDFLVHKMVLASRSDVFKVMFYGQFKESKEDRIEIKDVSVDTFRRFLEVIYTGKISDTWKFLEFPFNHGHHLDIYLIEEDEVYKSLHAHLTPSYKKLFHKFWTESTEILNIADRFNISPVVKEYFGFAITVNILDCNRTYCHQCCNSFIFAIHNGIDVERCFNERYLSISFLRSLDYVVREDPYGPYGLTVIQ